MTVTGMFTSNAVVSIWRFTWKDLNEREREITLNYLK